MSVNPSQVLVNRGIANSFRDVVPALRDNLGLFLGPVVACTIWLVHIGLEAPQQKAIAIIAMMIVYWLTEPIDHGLTALLGCYLFWALGIAKFSVAFSGFVNSTVWFLFGSLLMAEAAARSGLAKRLGYMFMCRVGSSSAQIQTGLVLLTFLLTFFVPSGVARIGLLASLCIGLIKATGLTERGNFAKSVFLTITTTGGVMDVMVLSGATSMMTRGIVEEQTGIAILWSQWLLACLPLNVLTMFATIAAVRWLYPTSDTELHSGRDYFQHALTEMGPWSSAEKKAFFWFLVAIVLWATDFIHHLNPAIVGIGAALALGLPKVGMLDAKAAKQVNFFVIIFSAGAISTGAVLAETKILPLLTSQLGHALTPFLSNGVMYTLAFFSAAFFYHFIFANRQTMLITSLPFLLAFAAAHGLNPVTAALLWTIAGGGGLFIYQSGVYVLGYSYGYFETKEFFKVGVLLTLFQAAVMVFLVRYYWPLLGLSWLSK